MTPFTPGEDAQQVPVLNACCPRVPGNPSHDPELKLLPSYSWDRGTVQTGRPELTARESLSPRADL